MDNSEANNKPNQIPVQPIYLLLGGLGLAAFNFVLYLNGSIYFLLMVITPMAIILGLVGTLTPNLYKSYNAQIIISIVSIIIGIVLFYSLGY